MKLRSRFSKKTEHQKTERVRFDAGECKRCKTARYSRVYKTDGKTRYCVCDGCGATWPKQGDFANPLIDIAMDVLDFLGNGDVVKTESDAKEVCLVDAKTAVELANRIASVLP